MQKVEGSFPAPAYFLIFYVNVFAMQELIKVKFNCNTLGWNTVPFFCNLKHNAVHYSNTLSCRN